ncbi:MAG: helix-turn-helix domain-containing protein, partial [Candidatus Acidiferrum sp.]
PALVAHFAQQVAKQNGWKEKLFSDEAIADLQRYSWPGNVRELRNVVERLILLSTGDRVTDDDARMAFPAGEISMDASASARGTTEQGTLEQRTEAFEREVLLNEIRRHNFHMTNVARALGLERSHLYKKCQQLGIDLQALRKPE